MANMASSDALRGMPEPDVPARPITRKAGVNSGKPCMDGIPVRILRGRFLAGESVALIAWDYELNVSDIEAALRCAIENPDEL